MGRIIAIDYGKKRVGIAVTDPCQIIANSLTTVRSHEVLQFLQAYCSKEKVDLIVVGHPKQMDNTDSDPFLPLSAASYRIYPSLCMTNVSLPYWPTKP